MRQHHQQFLSTLAVLGVVIAAAPASAQGGSDDWSRIIHRRACHPDNPCPLRAGLLWDSTNVGPRYPYVLEQAFVGGEAVVTFQVGADGVVDSNSVAVVRTSHQLFADAATAAVRRWRFGAETEQRPPEPVSVQVHLVFSHERFCRDNSSSQHTGWAATNQLVTAVCVRRTPPSN